MSPDLSGLYERLVALTRERGELAARELNEQSIIRLMQLTKERWAIVAQLAALGRKTGLAVERRIDEAG